MRTYSIVNLSTMETLTCTAPSYCWLKDLEDKLYIQWELTKARHNSSLWSILNGDHVVFTYHQVEFVEVWMDPNGRIMVRDLPQGWGAGV